MSSFQAAIERAKQRAENDAYEIRRTYYDEEFVFKFVPRATEEAIGVIARLQSQTDLAGKAASGSIEAEELDTLMRTITEFLDAQAMGETSELIAALMREHIIGIPELFEIQRAVIERVAGRPSISASSSPNGSSESGTPSTDGALPAPSIPQP